MQTKQYYREGLWNQIVRHPQYDLGKREIEALKPFLPQVSSVTNIQNILHLAIGDGREIPLLIRAFPLITCYLVDDILPSTIEEVRCKTKQQFPSVDFKFSLGDIEEPTTTVLMQRQLIGSTLIVLTGNSVIFSNRIVDKNVYTAMKPEDFFLLTVESPHERMYDSYQIEPVLRLLSESGIKVTSDNAKFGYDNIDQCMKILCGEKILLSSYKPTPKQLRERMTTSGFEEVLLQEYADLHMIGSLWKKS